MFDLTETPVTEFHPIPEGEYDLVCTSAEVKTTKAGDGKYIKGQFSITNTSYFNRRIFHNFNVENKNPQAVEIGFQDIKKFLLGAGMSAAEMRFKSAEAIAQALIDKKGTAKITVDGDQNRIKYWKLESGKTTAATTTPIKTAAARPAGGF